MNQRAQFRRLAAILAVAPSFILFTPVPALAATASTGALRCEGGASVITHQPVVNVGAGESGGFFAWQPALVNLNVSPPTVAQYGAWQYGYAHPGSSTPYWQRFDSGVIYSFENFTAPTTGYWGVYNFGYDYRTGQYFHFGYSTSGRYWCDFAPNLFIPNP